MEIEMKTSVKSVYTQNTPVKKKTTQKLNKLK